MEVKKVLKIFKVVDLAVQCSASTNLIVQVIQVSEHLVNMLSKLASLRVRGNSVFI